MVADAGGRCAQRLVRQWKNLPVTTVGLGAAELEAGVGEILGAPADEGLVELLVRRPDVRERETPGEIVLDLVEGVVGDNWLRRGSTSTPDGKANPEAQVTIMNARVAALVAGGDRNRWALAGDQIYVDFDLSQQNLPAARARSARHGCSRNLRQAAYGVCEVRGAVRFRSHALRQLCERPRPSPAGRELPGRRAGRGAPR